MALTKKQLKFKEEIIIKLKKQQGNLDFELCHQEADKLLCHLLEELDCKDVVDEFKKVGKWYA